MATKAGDNPLKARLRAVWKTARDKASPPPAAPARGGTSTSSAKPVEPLAPADDRAAFHAAVAGTTPLPPDNRVELAKARPRRLPPRQKPDETRADVSPPRQHDADLPAHWRNAGTPPKLVLPDDPEAAALMLAMAGVQAIPAPNRAHLAKPLPPPRPKQFVADERAALHESLHGPIGLQDRLEGGDEPNYLRNGLANTVLRDLRRNRWVIQDEVDLHGLNRDEARHLLAGFLAECLQHGWRCVRVIHGKGHGSPQKLSILRQLVRGWLAQRQEVLAYCQAKPQDGGEGALLVLLRSAKKQGTA
ncbi:MAG: Smr/MutS family protein [Azonexus sp.]